MKRFIATGILMLCALTVTFAQNPLNTGENQLNFGVGIDDHSIPVYAGIDFGIGYDFSLGIETSYRNWDNHYSTWFLGGNVNYHFNRILNIPRMFDFYAGANLGAYFYNYDDHYYHHHDDHSCLGLGVQVGGRIYLTPSVALNLELGGGSEFSTGKFGVSFRL